MNISGDLDGFVLQGGHLYFFRTLDIIRKLDPQATEQVEMEFYASRLLKYHPSRFLSEGDKFFIITCRKPKAQKVTKDTLRKYDIRVPIIFADEKGEIDWSGSYEEASKKAAQLKAKIIKELGIELHFDNNPIMVGALREICPGVKIILVSE